ncbi:MAG: hypothetical protein WA867_06775 [Candidatus Acidiferrales bacterium]
MKHRKHASVLMPRFSKLFTGALACVILAALAWGGGDPWKAKPYQQWDANDIKKIFNDSPWCKIVQIDVSWKASNLATAAATGDASGAGGVKAPGIGNTQPGSQPGSAPSQASAPASQPGPGEAPPQPTAANFIVRWISSRTIREAGYRNSVLEGKLKEDEAEKQLALPVDAYKVYLGGPDMTPFQSMDEKALQGAAVLIGKKTKQHISATKAELVHSEDGKTLQGIVFSFPMQTGGAEPSISPNEKAVEFNCVVGKVKIQTTFDLSKMEDSKGRDI